MLDSYIYYEAITLLNTVAVAEPELERDTA
jgi:hypothetical protein